MVRDVTIIRSGETTFYADTILSIDASDLNSSDLENYISANIKSLDSIIFNFTDSQKEGISKLIARGEAERLTSEERQAIRKFAEDLGSYAPDKEDLLAQLEDYRSKVYDAYVELGEKELETKTPKKAIEWFGDAIEIYPRRNSEPYRGKGTAYSLLKKKKKGILFYNQALGIDPEDSITANLLEKLLSKQDIDTKADRVFEKGNKLLNKSKYKKASKMYKKAESLGYDKEIIEQKLSISEEGLEKFLAGRQLKREALVNKLGSKNARHLYTGSAFGLSGLLGSVGPAVYIHANSIDPLGWSSVGALAIGGLVGLIGGAYSASLGREYKNWDLGYDVVPPVYTVMAALGIGVIAGVGNIIYGFHSEVNPNLGAYFWDTFVKAGVIGGWAVGGLANLVRSGQYFKKVAINKYLGD